MSIFKGHFCRLFSCLFFSAFLCSGLVFSKNLNSKNKAKSKPISVLILFYGDYKAEIQFDGVVQEKITGIQSESSDFKANTECEISASFQEVQYLNSRHLKIQFVSGCNSMEKTILSPEYVRLKDLKIESASIYFSNTHKNVQFKIKDLKY